MALQSDGSVTWIGTYPPPIFQKLPNAWCVAVATQHGLVVFAPEPPTVTTLAATGVNGDALLNGTVNPEGSATAAWFEWGTSTAYGNRTPCSDAGSGKAAIPVNFRLSGLTPGAAFHYRITGTPRLSGANGFSPKD